MNFEEYIKTVEEFARQRKRFQGEKFSEVDFFTGAMVVFEFFNSMDQLPAHWVFFPLMNKSILDDLDVEVPDNIKDKAINLGIVNKNEPS